MKNIKPLSNNIFKTRMSYLDQLEIMDELITKRIDFIYIKIAKIFNTQYEDWFFDRCDIDNSIDHETGNFIEINGPHKVFNIIFEKSVLNLNAKLPLKWLTVDFEKELLNGKTEYDEKYTKNLLKIKLDSSGLQDSDLQILGYKKVK